MIQAQFLNKILDTKDPTLVTLNNLSAEFFSDYKDEFNFIKNHLEQYGNVPDKETFLNVFPDFDLMSVSEGSRYLLDALYDDRNKRLLAETFNKVREHLMRGNTEKAMQTYSEMSEKLLKAKHLEAVDIYSDIQRYDEYVDRTSNFAKYYVKTGFDELDRVIGGWDRKEELATIVARTNTGKCLAKGTKVLMADGTTKNVEDVVVGDRVQSYNRVNTVLALHSGVSHGYKIIPKRGEPFVVSDNHILTIMQLVEMWDKNRNQMVTNNVFELKDITVEEYLSYSSHKKRLCRLFYPKIEYEKKDLKIPPYILGVWIGDGTSCRVEITNVDHEVVEEWCAFGHQFGCVPHFYDNSGKRATTIALTNSVRGNNLLIPMFKEYDLFNNKHIPLDYLTGSRQQRLDLLAGLLDTDGYYDGNCYEIAFKQRHLIEQVAQLARGLGFRVGCIKSKHNKKYNRDYYQIYISGDFSDLPLRVEHKKPVRGAEEKRQLSLTGFTVEPVDRVEYYGFMCDGDERYILANGILTHNTWALLNVIQAAAKQGLRVGLYSGEMSVNKVGYRIDTLISHISNTKMTHGNDSIQVDYKKFLEDASKELKDKIYVLTPINIGGIAGVSALRAFIEKYKLDMLCIDQHSLLEDDRGAKNPVERASNISKDLKNLQVMTGIPIISVSQQNRESTEEKGVGTQNIAQSDRIGQDSTTVIFLERKDDIMTLYLGKARDTVVGAKLNYRVNLDTGTFTFIPNENDATGGADCDGLRDEFEYDTGTQINHGQMTYGYEDDSPF